MGVQKALEKINVLLKNVTDPVAKIIISRLLHITEASRQWNRAIKEENHKLRNQINRLKGERINSHSQDQHHKRSKSKNHKIKINKTVRWKINPERLPEDAIFKGCKSVILQEVRIKASNIKFLKEGYYSPSFNKTFIARVPDGYEGELG